MEDGVLPPELVQVVEPPQAATASAPDRVVQGSARLGRVAGGLWIGGPALIVLAASLLHTGAQREVLLPWSTIALPETCTFHTSFGLDCPGCGLTRSFIHLAHANPWTALQLNPMSVPLFMYVVSQIPLAILHLRGFKPPWVKKWTKLNEWLLIAMIIGLALQWIMRIVIGAL